MEGTVIKFSLFSFLMPSSEDKIEENNESDGDQNSNDPVHVFPAAHLHFDVLGGLFHHDRLFFEWFTLTPSILKVLATNECLLQIIHYDRFCLLQTLSQLAHFRAIVRIVVPLSHKLRNSVLVLSERCLCTRSLERHIKLFITVSVTTRVHLNLRYRLVSGFFAEEADIDEILEVFEELLALLSIDLIWDDDGSGHCAPIVI